MCIRDRRRAPRSSAWRRARPASSWATRSTARCRRSGCSANATSSACPACPQGLPELLDGAIRAGALRDLPAVPAPLVALARRLADGLRGDAAVGSKDEFAAHLAALRSRLDVLVPLSRDLARDAPGPEGGEKSVALDVVRELDAWTRARLVEGLRAVLV